MFKIAIDGLYLLMVNEVVGARFVVDPFVFNFLLKARIAINLNPGAFKASFKASVFGKRFGVVHF